MIQDYRLRSGLLLTMSFLLGLLAGQAGSDGWRLDPLLLSGPGALGAIGLALLLRGRRRRRQVLERERTARAVAEAQLRHLAHQDALTGLLNRASFVEQLHGLLAGGRRSDRSVAVLTLDLVDFKAINDTQGHSAGDLLLRHAGTRLLARLRDRDLIARMGADEFAIVQTGVQEPAAAARLGERLLEALEEPFDLFGQRVTIGARIGVAIGPGDGIEAEQLLQRAGIALQRAKRDGARSCRFFESGMDAELRRRRELERDLHRALPEGQLELYYQPQINLVSRQIVGFEALLRWRHPARGMISPDVFIPLAEDSELIIPIGAWVLERACRQARRWQEAGPPALRIAVNLSPVQFRAPDLPLQVALALEQASLAPECLELEITERVLMEDSETVLDALNALRTLGVRISIDDFGVGNASLAYLRQFAFDEIKVDRSFVGAMADDVAAAAVVRAALTLSRSLEMTAVAEGVETAAQVDLLAAAGCPLAQGYYFSPPVTVAEVDAMLGAITGDIWRVDPHFRSVS